MRLIQALGLAATEGGSYPVAVNDLVGLYQLAGENVPSDIASQEEDAEITVNASTLLSLNSRSKNPIALEM